MYVLCTHDRLLTLQQFSFCHSYTKKQGFNIPSPLSSLITYSSSFKREKSVYLWQNQDILVTVE